MALNFLTYQHRILLFINIFIDLLNADIQFKGSKPLPLILHASFQGNNKFKHFCEKFIEVFAYKTVIWNQEAAKVTEPVKTIDGKSKPKYIRDNKRSVTLHDNYVESVEIIKNQLKEMRDEQWIKQCIMCFHNWIRQETGYVQLINFYCCSIFILSIKNSIAAISSIG